MIPGAAKLRRALRHFKDGTAGNISVEFVIVFPAVMLLFGSAVESGIFMMRNAMLERGLDVAVREMRIGGPTPPSYWSFKQTLCAQAVNIPNCATDVMVEMTPISTSTWAPMDNSPRCINREARIDPADEDDFFQQGADNELMLVRVCANVDPILPHFGLGLILDSDGANGYAIVAKSVFVNEPGS